MTIPAAVFALLCAWLIGALFHVAVDGGGGRLVLYLILSTLGFIAGQTVAAARGWSFVPVGPLQLGFAALGSLVFLVLGHWLGQVRIERPAHDGKA